MKKQINSALENVMVKYDNQLLDIISSDLRSLKNLRSKTMNSAAMSNLISAIKGA